MNTRTMSDVVGRGKEQAQALTSQMNSMAARAKSLRGASKTTPPIPDSVQNVAQENLLTMVALIVGATLTSIARLLDTKRTQSRKAKKVARGPLLGVAAAAVVAVVGVALSWLMRRRPGTQAGQALLLAWLNDAYSMEMSLARTLQEYAKDAKGHPEIEARLEQHLEQTRRHADLVKSCIERLGGGTSSIKAVLGAVMGKVQGLSTGPAQDELMKNALAGAAVESFEVASYTALVAAAQELGDQETASLCRQILQEDEEMARWIGQSVPMIARDTLDAMGSTSK